MGHGMRRNNEFNLRREKSPMTSAKRKAKSTAYFSGGTCHNSPVLGTVPFACDPTSLSHGSWNVTPAATNWR